jgi:hypothetical protein|tara:strand:- start:224 stop:493 length:270 start_codon:yes stop_codon:yes gene_type:complete
VASRETDEFAQTRSLVSSNTNRNDIKGSRRFLELSQRGFEEVHPTEVRPFEVRIGEVRPGKVRPWFDLVAVDFHDNHVTGGSAGLPEVA